MSGGAKRQSDNATEPGADRGGAELRGARWRRHAGGRTCPHLARDISTVGDRNVTIGTACSLQSQQAIESSDSTDKNSLSYDIGLNHHDCHVST
jgi:hypothetical protein